MQRIKQTIFIDLDGVCADFEKFYEEAFEHRHDSVEDAEMWRNINAHGKFFSNLPIMPGTLEFIERFRRGCDLIILTACPRSDYQRAALQKKAWVKEHIGNYMVLPVLGGKNKYLFMQTPGDILIDDFDKNITPWNDNGGLGIVHTDWKTTTEKIERLLA